MRTSLAKSLLRAQLLSSKPSGLAASPFAVVLRRARRGLANVRDSQKQSSSAWFSGSSASFQVSNSGPGSGKDHKPPDERTLKLGKSELKSLIQNFPIPNSFIQPYEFSTTDYLRFWSLHSLKKFSPLRSPSVSFLQLIHIYPQLAANLHTSPRCGLHQ